MEKTINHRPFILIGCLIWIVSFFGEAFRFQPYSTYGIIISLLLTFFGIYRWFIFYKTTRGNYPKFFNTWKGLNKKMRKNPFAGFEFMIEHLFETWTFTIVGWMGLVLIIVLTFGNSNPFSTTKKYCENNQKIIEKTGEIKYYGLLVGGNISTDWDAGGHADLSFTIVGEKGNFSAKSELIKSNGKWQIVEVKIE